MKLRQLSVWAVTAAFLMGTSAGAAMYEVDTAHSAVGFSIRHLMISNVQGSFGEFAGMLDTADLNDLTKAKIEFTVKTASINTANAKRDEHLRSPEFFETEKFPEAKFVAEKITKAGKDKYKLAGKLSLHGVTKDVTFDLVSHGKVKDPWGNEKLGFQATTELVRKDFGLVWNKALDNGGVALGEKAKLTVDLELQAKK